MHILPNPCGYDTCFATNYSDYLLRNWLHWSIKEENE